MTISKPWSLVLQAMPAVAVLGWRVATLPVSACWKDLLILLSLYWGFVLFAPRRGVVPVTYVLACLLLGIYAWGQLDWVMLPWKGRP
jgi:hypothetical protein